MAGRGPARSPASNPGRPSPGPSCTGRAKATPSRSCGAARDEDHAEAYQVHPGLLDAGFQLLGAAACRCGQRHRRLRADEHRSAPVLQSSRRPDVLHHVDHVAGGQHGCWRRAARRPSGRLLVKLEVRLRLACARLSPGWLGPIPDWCYELAWIPQPLTPPSPQTPDESGRWLIFDARDGMGRSLAEQLVGKGQAATVVPAGGDPDSRRASAVAEFLSDKETSCRGVVYLAGLDADGEPDAPDFAAARECVLGGTLDVVHALTASKGTSLPRLWLVTRGAQAVGDRPMPLALARSRVGLGPGHRRGASRTGLRRIDLDPEVPGCGGQLRRGTPWEPRRRPGLSRQPAAGREASSPEARRGEMSGDPQGQPYRLEITSRGQLDNVALRPVSRVRPGPGQVEIRSRARA